MRLHRHVGSGAGYDAAMTTKPEPSDRHDRPIDLEGVPDEEEISEADAAERVERDPDEQENQEER